MHAVVLSDIISNPTGLKLREMLRARVNGEEPVVVPFEQAERYLAQGRTDLLVLVLSPDPDRALAMLQRVRRHMPGPMLAVGQASESKLILRALHEGADQYLDEADLETQLEAVLARLESRALNLSAPTGRLYALLGASGGSGTSTLAVNLAAVFAQEHDVCALVDLKAGVGDLSALLDLKPTHNLADLCLNASRMDRAMFQSALVIHDSGIHLLAPPQLYDDIRLVTTRGVHQTLTLARECFAHTVVDVEDCFHEEQVVALRLADVVLLVFRLDFTSLRNTRRILEYLEQLQVPADRIRLVINRYGQAKELPAEEAEEALGERVAFFIPDDAKTINGANNAGIPAVLKTPSARVCQSIAQMGRKLQGYSTTTTNGHAGRGRSGWLASFR